ncbi:helix-hairpin-helix domain-containing protein [Halogeometricum sp. S1BR25-6]|uniref:Helix-hairpin-helix domain-containing protein n=1 Tax=Halogeometricum salsisoli TaxID=2950536 RepID=A0ABU2GDA0_9EURY|nr:helix-hairpin-helix domain-containing protein [Halogeometricum sp. S1BR25-6]MDS0298767.1 helix-hairpin-helix domain-containing protein [Halogeometricum sp. S1BR25-6]
MNQGADNGREGDDAAGGSDGVEDRPGEGDAADGDAGAGERGDSDDGGGEDLEGTVAEGDPESWSAAAPTDGDGAVPLPWTVADEEEEEEEESGESEESLREESEETFPEAFEDLRFVGPKTGAALRDSPIDVEDVARKRVSYRDLTAHGVNPGVAAKIRREHSLSWSFDAEDGDLSRRSSQVRGLDDDERAWVAASSGWAGDEPSAAETDGSGDATSAESAWQTRSGSDGADRADRADEADGTAESVEHEAESTPDAEAEWRAAAEGTASEGPTRDEEAEWRAKSTPAGAGTDEADEETAWRERATESEAATRSDANDSSSDDAEAAWRERSAPTPVTVLDGVDDDQAGRLADAGIRSVRRLATADPASVADALELDERRVREWCEAARARVE